MFLARSHVKKKLSWYSTCPRGKVCATLLVRGERCDANEKIKSYEDLDAEPEVGFFAKINFLVYSKTKYFRKRTMKMLNIFGRYCA